MCLKSYLLGMSYPIHHTPTALITGGSRGLGFALAQALASRRWRLVIDGRDHAALEAAATTLQRDTSVEAVAGDVADPSHRAQLTSRIPGGRLDVLVNNASELGPTPLPTLADTTDRTLSDVLRVNALAPLDLVRRSLARLQAAGGIVINISSDAAVEAYPGWGLYGASKAALDQISRVLAVEHPELSVYAFDPGDMRTGMHQAAFPGEDISDRPEPKSVVPSLLRIIDERPASGRLTHAGLSPGKVS